MILTKKKASQLIHHSKCNWFLCTDEGSWNQKFNFFTVAVDYISLWLINTNKLKIGFLWICRFLAKCPASNSITELTYHTVTSVWFIFNLFPNLSRPWCDIAEEWNLSFPRQKKYVSVWMPKYYMQHFWKHLPVIYYDICNLLS